MIGGKSDATMGMKMRRRWGAENRRALLEVLRGGGGGIAVTHEAFGDEQALSASFDDSDDLPDTYPVTVNGVLNLASLDVQDRLIDLHKKKIKLIPLGSFDDSIANVIRLEKNYIARIDDYTFRRIPCLEFLSAWENSIHFLSEKAFENTRYMKHIDLNDNRLTTIAPETFRHLEYLNHLSLARNNITSLPYNVFHGLKRLEEISLSDTGITSLAQDTFKDLHNLRILDLNNNKLKWLPSTLFRNLTNLRVLCLSNNLLEALPSDIFQDLHNLRGLFLSCNNIQSLSPELFQPLKNLRLLHIWSNNITTLPRDLFKGLNFLEKVVIFDNPAVYFFKRHYRGGNRKELECMGVRYFNGTYPGVPEGFFDAMTRRSQWSCKFFPCNDGFPRSAAYIKDIMTRKVQDQSPFEHTFNDPEPKEVKYLDPKEIAMGKKEKELRNQQLRIEELESKLVQAKEETKVIKQDLTRIKDQMVQAGLADRPTRPPTPT